MHTEIKIGFIVNGRIKKLAKTIKNIDRIFFDYNSRIYTSTHAGHFDELCKEALEDKCNNLIFVGGDGSLNEGVNGFLNHYKLNKNNQPNDYDWDAIKKIKIGVYPAGSGNDFSRTIYKDTSLDALKKLIDNQSSKFIDVGWASFQNLENKKDTRFFMNITDVGMGSVVVSKKANLPKWFGSGLTYFWAITSTLVTYKNCSVKAYNNFFSWEGKVINMVVANGKYFGNGLGVAPNAEISNGKFAVVIIGDINLLDYFKNLRTIKKCIRITHPKVSYHNFKEINIEATSSKKITIDMDGEYIGEAPMNLKCLSKKITFIA